MHRTTSIARVLALATLAACGTSTAVAQAQSTALDPAGPPLAPTPPAEEAPARQKKSEGAFDNPYFAVNAERRSGVVIGLVMGGGASSARGTPIKFNQRAQSADPGVAGAGAQTLFVGGAFTDWFSFHIGYSGSSATKGDLVTAGGGLIFGLETWPLFPLGGFFRDFGIGADFGAGSASIKRKSDSNVTLAEGGGASLVRATAFWDGLRFWQMNLGPYVAFETRNAETYSEQLYLIGGRLAFYGGP